VLGRSRSCELSLHAVEASRRHAAVRYVKGQFRVRDLGSTNGTLLNGQPLDAERALEPGDRIEIGGVTVSFCHLDEAMEQAMLDHGEGETMLMARPYSVAKDALRGDFEQIPSFAVLQILEMGNQSGLLSVETPAGTGRMWMEDGRLIHAETEKLEGMAAAIEIAQNSSGHFRFEPGEAPESCSIQASVTEVILEASRLMDEAGGSLDD
jgi:pSer/pThr/pTyr-binding forkhead associated (FHA) protein